MGAEISIRSTADAQELDLLEPLWGALQDHHATVLPALGDQTPARSHATREAAPHLIDLVDRGLIRILDLVFLHKDEDGSLTRLEVNWTLQIGGYLII
jgi:hypothetical protein